MLQTAGAIILFLFPLAWSPGPGNIFFAANGARFGFRATLPANAGYHLSTWLVTAAAGFGLITVLDTFPQAFGLLKTVVALYVLWIAWKLLRAGTMAGQGHARAATFTNGIVLLVFNPKACLIMALMFTQFANTSDKGRIFTVLFIATIFTLNNLVAFMVWASLGDRIAGYFRDAGSAAKLNVLFGGILAAVGLWMLAV